jgi:ceramide glucosyltransferase
VFLPEILSGALFPAVAAAILADALDAPVAISVVALLTLWYGAEMALARAARWPVDRFYPLYGILRDLALPLLWIDGWLGSEFEWRGTAMRVERAAEDARAG